ncbi:hypothetical protein PR048_011855 [Dryococelus australis]|uniref:Uncharacterized protein n=1 Tax=Dryococelus australis TaxID=614101 RepID=A0ABQ9HMV0_9NEOP|nr:hypothetical protein PR048_011855 [Dryococelus australis]
MPTERKLSLDCRKASIWTGVSHVSNRMYFTNSWMRVQIFFDEARFELQGWKHMNSAVDHSDLTLVSVLVFLRVESSLGIEVHLIEEYATAVPIKKTRIPWLEVLAATIATRLASKTAYNLWVDVSNINFWSWVLRFLHSYQHPEDKESVHPDSFFESSTTRLQPGVEGGGNARLEVLIGVLKSLLRRVLGKAMMNFEEQLTVICDCEAVLNARHLTYMLQDPRELVALNPAMFLQDVKEIGVPDCDQVDLVDLKGGIRYLQNLREDLKERFRSDFLGQVVSTHWSEGGSSIMMVIVGSDKEKCLDWPLGVVE